MAKRNLGRRKFRSALTILGVLIGIAAIVSLMTVGYGMRHQVETTLNEMLGAGIFMSSGSGGVDIPEYVSEIVQEVPGVNESVPIIMTTVDVNGRFITVVGINPAKARELYHITFEAGRGLHPDEDDAAVLGYTTALNLGVWVNDTITLGARIGGVGRPFRVVGILRSIGAGQMNIGCFITLKAAQELFDREGYVSAILIRLENPSLGEEVEEALQRMFPDANVVRQEELMRDINRVMNIINGVLVALGSISLGIGAIGIMNTVMMSVHERRREIGMLKAVGAERWHVLLIFLSEALLISLIGGILGCIAGLAGVRLIQWFVGRLGLHVTIPILISPQIISIAMLAAVTVGTMAGLYPSWKAANVRPVEALRYE